MGLCPAKKEIGGGDYEIYFVRKAAREPGQQRTPFGQSFPLYARLYWEMSKLSAAYKGRSALWVQTESGFVS